MTGNRPLNCFLPPHILNRLLESSDAEIREAARTTLLTTTRLRGQREILGSLVGLAGPAQGRRTVSDCKNGTFLPLAVLARSEDGPESPDRSVNQAFEGLGKTRQFYLDVFGRNSIDDRGMRLDGYVHFGFRYNNAFWDGREMVFGDGDGRVFGDTTGSLDVIAHELTHGVTERTAGLVYHNEPGALNESISDVMGSLVKQWSLRQTADQADWLIGADVFTPDIQADALRSLKAPGEAYDTELLGGKDPQPAHMRDFVHSPDTEEGDHGGVHINSGIPNKAFYLTAVGIGGYAWEAPGHIWYESLRASTPTTDFQGFADTTHAKAGELYGLDSAEQKAVQTAWDGVGITVTTEPRASRRTSAATGKPPIADVLEHLAEMSASIETLRRDLERQAAGTVR